MAKPQVEVNMWAVWLDGVGLIATTTAYNRKECLDMIMGIDPGRSKWRNLRKAGYRLVRVTVQVWDKVELPE